MGARGRRGCVGGGGIPGLDGDVGPEVCWPRAFPKPKRSHIFTEPNIKPNHRDLRAEVKCLIHFVTAVAMIQETEKKRGKELFPLLACLQVRLLFDLEPRKNEYCLGLHEIGITTVQIELYI